MFKKIILVASIFFASAGTAALAADQGGIAQEVRAGWLTLPTEATGRLVVKVCDSCSTREFEITAQSTYEIGGFHVRIDEMRRELATRPRQLLLLQLTPDLKKVDRIVISSTN
jgi:hypothetical protein